MAISVIQRQTGTDTLGSTGGVSIIFGTNNTVHNAIIALGWIEASANSGLSTPTDTQGNTYTQILSINNGLVSIGLVVWVCYDIKAGANTITMNDGFNIANLHVYEVSGLAHVSAFDKSAFQYQLSQTTLNSGNTSTTTNSIELLIGAFGLGLSSAPTWTAGSGYSNLTSQNQTFLNTATEEQIVSSQAAYSATASVLTNLNGNSLAAILTFSANSDVNVSDTTVTSEAPTVAAVNTLAVFDTTVTSNLANLFIPNLAINVSDTTVTSNTAIVFSDHNVSVSDTTTTSQTLDVTQTYSISASDTTVTSENITFSNTPIISVNDTTFTIEDRFVVIPVAGTLAVTVEDDVYIIDSPLFNSVNRVNVNDLTLAIENVQLGGDLYLQVSDTTVTSENAFLGQGQPVNVSDTTITSENVSIIVGLVISRTSLFNIIVPSSINFSLTKT